MNEEEPIAPPEVQDPLPEMRRLSTGEQFLLWMGILLPGILSPVFVFGWFLIGYTQPAGHVLWLILIPAAWLAILLACCYLCGWIHAVKRGTEDRRRRAMRAGGLFLLGQIVVSPTLGFGCCMTVASIGGM
jgi:hypothetical protein